MPRSRLYIALPLALALGAVPAAEAQGFFDPVDPADPVARIDLAGIRQSIDGFGASTAWHGAIGDAEADAAFGNDANQLGLTLLRVRIDPFPGAWAAEGSNSAKARAHGAKILATPWSPPPALKTNNNPVGGELRADAYPAYAAHLKSFCDFAGKIDVVSIQNEPNIKVTYESCSWSGEQIRDFCKTQAGAIGVPVMMPEAFNFDPALSDPTLDDPDASANAPYLGGHLYGAKPFPYAKAINAGKRIWMTEFYLSDDNAMGMLQMGRQMLDCLVNGMHAYIWGTLSLPGGNLINRDGSLRRKGFVMAQFAKFIRPGARRLEATYQPQPGIFVAAFQGDQVAIVAINQTPVPKSQAFAFENGTLPAPRKYTSSTAKGMLDEGIAEVTGDGFTATLDPQSVTTFVAAPGTAIRIGPKGLGAGKGGPAPIRAYLPTGRRLPFDRLPFDGPPGSGGRNLPILLAP
jgi:glucuronoarabinoxylan endo-1,4-beta-xylanase